MIVVGTANRLFFRLNGTKEVFSSSSVKWQLSGSWCKELLISFKMASGGYRGEGHGHPSRSNQQRHPSHLRGKSIGMYYAKRGRAKQQVKEDQQRLVVNMTENEESEIIDMLRKVQSMDYSSSYGSTSLSKWESASGSTVDHKVWFSSRPPLQRNYQIDEHLYEDMLEKSKTPNFSKMFTFRKSLPSYKVREDLLRLVEENQIVVITGETGCGKTTQVPQYILESFIESHRGSICRIVCTQPRRISAISVAERVAQERCVPCGRSEVGFQIRLESKLPRDHGSILYCTTGILLQQLQFVPNLDGFSHVLVDEVHEQDLQSDFLLINLKDILAVRKDLKVILMSATLNAEEFASYFGGCPMLQIPGFTYPVEVFTLEDMIEMTNYRSAKSRGAPNKPVWLKHTRKGKEDAEKERLKRKQMEGYLRDIEHKYSYSTIETLKTWDEDNIDLDLIVAMLRYINMNGKEGAVLVFLPGWQQISKLNRLITENMFFSPSRFRIIPLHSLMPTISQREIFESPPRGVQKIVLATNIAETSITIDDVVHVIDCGKIKMKSLDPLTNIQLLQPEWVSVSNMKQRRGRAGRTQPGFCYHMFTKLKELELSAYQLPEMLRSSLEELILKIKILKLGRAIPFLSKAMHPPEEKTVLMSLNILQKLNALTSDETLTPLGYHLARLPMDPHTGKMVLLGAIFCCLDPILSVAASLSFKDAFVIPLGKESEVDFHKCKLAAGSQSDHLMFAKVIQGWEKAERQGYGHKFCYENFLSQSTLRMLANLKKQFTDYLQQMHFIKEANPKHPDYNLNSENESLLKAIICAGFYPHVAEVRKGKINPRFKKTLKAISEDGLKVCLHPKSVNAFEPEIKTNWLVYHLKIKSNGIYLHDTTIVSPYSLLFFGGKVLPSTVRGHDSISVDDWIIFHCSRRKADLVSDLRQELDKLLEHKIMNPGVCDWHSDTKEANVLKCIVKLLTSEETITAADLEVERKDQQDWNSDDDEDFRCSWWLGSVE